MMLGRAGHTDRTEREVSGGLRRQLAALSVGALGVTSFAGYVSSPASIASHPPVTSALARVEALRDGGAQIANDGPGGLVTFIAAPTGRPLTGASDDDAGTTARRFVDVYAPAFGVAHPSTDLVEARQTATLTGTAVRFAQQLHGVPVLAGELVVAVDADGAVTSTAGQASAATDVTTAPTIDATAASRAAIDVIARDLLLPADGLAAAAPTLTIFDPVLLHAPGIQLARLVWRTEVSSPDGTVDWFVLVDATTGGIALRFEQFATAKNRQVCDNANNSSLSPICSSPVLTEGGNVAGQNTDVQNAYNYAGVTYDFYQSVLGRNGIDNAGMTMKATVRYCPDVSSCPYANAAWSQALQQMVYGAGYASALDVVGHEITHGVTEKTSGLLYYGQSGALNESMSDVMGELIQLSTLAANNPEQTAWLGGENLPGGAIRSMSNPPAYGDPDRMTSPLYQGTANDGYGVHTNSGVNNKAAYVIAVGGSFNGQNLGTGLGITKTAKIYYQAQTALLAPGSDYLDLSHVLPAACTALVPSGAVSALDCTKVSQAVTATEMALAPTTPGASLKKAPCPDGQTVSSQVMTDSFDNGGASWLVSTSPVNAAANWAIKQYQSATKAAEAPDIATTSRAFLKQATGVVIPAGTTYLSFEHAFQFDYGTDNGGNPSAFWDGGIVAYSTNGVNGTYSDIASLAGASIVNGYNHTLTTYSGDTNPFAGYPAFSGVSPGVQTTIVNVSSLAGQTVNLEFIAASDSTVGALGWVIDNVSVYQCATPAPTTTTTTTPPTTAPPTTTPPAPAPGYVAVQPCRLADSRVQLAFGRFPAGAQQIVNDFQWHGAPCNIPSGATALSMNVTVVNPSAAGYVTVYPCANADHPNAASVNYLAHETVGNSVISAVSTAPYPGMICVFSYAETDVVIDVTGYFPAGSAYTAMRPQRILETRSWLSTADGQFNGISFRLSGTTLELPVAGRVGIPAGASAVAMNVTVTGTVGDGFLTVYPCDAPRPNASSLNYAAHQTKGNLVISKLSATGTVCLFTYATTDIIVDVVGNFPAGSSYSGVNPARLSDSRPGYGNVDGRPEDKLKLPATYAKWVAVRGRGGVPSNATAVVLNVTVVDPDGDGFVIVYPCTDTPPWASSLNYSAHQTVGSTAMAKLSADGKVCLYTHATTDLIVDVTGYFT